MNSLPWILLTAASTVAACNYTVGECYPRDQGGGSAGAEGGVLVPGGVGGYGDAPPKQPQDVGSPPPDCNIVPQSPCNEKCLADYEAEAGTCGQAETSSARQSCQGAAYDHYKKCRTACDSDPVEQCKKICDHQYDACVTHCTTLACYAACMVTYKNCLRNC